MAAKPLTVEEKRARLAAALAKKAQQPIEAPLSFNQQRLWFVDQLDPGNPLYNITGAARIIGDARYDFAEKATRQIVARHEPLRTTFALRGTEPVQLIAPSGTLPVEFYEIDALPGATVHDKIERLARAQTLTRFNLATGPLMRAAAVKLGENDHVVCVTGHHIISDGWSIGVVLFELAALHAQESGIQSQPLPELKIRYRDFVRWQREKLQGPELARLLSFWEDQLAGAPQVLELPTDRPRPPRVTYAGTIYRFAFGPALLEALKELSRREGVTLFMTLLAGYASLLYRYSGQEDLLIGMPTTGRERAEIQPLVGYFVNVVAVRIRLGGRPTFRELLRSIKKSVLDSYAHQDVPFDKLVEALQPKRTLNRNPLIQAVYLHQSFPMPKREAARDFDIRPWEVHPGFSRFELGFRTEPDEHGIACIFEYNTDLFFEQTIARMAGHLRTMLESVTANPDQRVAEIPLGDLGSAVVRGDDQAVPALSSATLVDAFQRQVLARANEPAIVQGGRTVTFGELGEWSHRVARHLQASGVSCEERVAVLASGLAELAAGMLGTMQAGGAFVDCDLDDPAARIAHILADSGAVTILAQDEAAVAIAHSANAHLPRPIPVFSLTDFQTPTKETDRNEGPRPAARAGSLCGVLYATGAPSGPLGMAFEHQHVLRQIQAAESTYGLAAGQSHCLIPPFLADSPLIILTALVTGGSVVAASPEESSSLWRLRNFLTQHAVDVWHTYPRQLASLLEEHKSSAAAAIAWPQNCLIVGGEDWHPELAGRLKAAAPQLTAFSQFGLLESGGCSLWHEVVPSKNGAGAEAAPLGQPAAGTLAVVLDSSGQHVPVNVPGELAVGGACLARGYLTSQGNRDDDFVQLPQLGGKRLYRTGVAVRQSADNTLRPLGRTDNLWRIRGYRVCCQEIERLLRGHERIADCVVITRQLPNPGDDSSQASAADQHLVAYVVVHPGGFVTPDELRRSLQSQAPAYMVPAAFIMLDRLPRSADGQIDRGALPAPRGLRISAADHLRPQTRTEQRLVEVWQDLLGIQGIGIHEDFFELGGNSLLAMQLINQLREHWPSANPSAEVLQQPTIANIARWLDSLEGNLPAELARPIPKAPEGAPQPLSASQQLLFLMEQFDRTTAFNALVGVRLTGPLDRPQLEQALAALVRRHEILSAAVQVVDAQPVLVTPPPAPPTLSFIDVSQLAPAEREPEAIRRAEGLTKQRFNLSRGGLVRFLLVRLEDQEHRLFAVMHHLICDGWSFPILWRDLAALYDAARRDDDAGLPELPIQFTDYASWQVTRQDADSRAQAEYWRKKLAAPLPLLDLPTDYSRPASIRTEPGICALEIPAQVSADLLQIGRQMGATPFVTLLATYLALLQRYSHADDLIVGTPTANRLRPETRDLIGFFAGVLPLRVDLSGDPTFLELLDRVRETAVEAFGSSEPDWQSLAGSFSAPDPGRMPVCQAFFTLGQFPEEPLETGALRWQPFDHNVVRVTGFDVVLALHERRSGLGGALLYRTDLFRRETIEQMAGCYGELLASIAASPTARLSQLSAVPPDQRRLLLETWNDTAQPFPSDLCVPDLLESQAARTPQATAVIDGGQELTYAELNDRANRLAQRLRELQVEPEKLVAVFMDKSADLIAALVAVWKAGGAYLPIDVSWPGQRVRSMLENAAATVVLTHSPLHERLATILAGIGGTELVDVDQALQEVPGPVPNPSGGATPTSLAYVIYTSGSTGVPKGVMIEQRSVVNVVTSFCRTYGLTAEDRALQQSSIAFDVSVNEIFPILAAGGALVIPAQTEVADFERLAALIAQHRVTIMGATPTALAELNRRADELQSLRLVLSGGEALSRQDVTQLVKFATVTNGYGPTETTVCATYFDLRSLSDGDASAIPIGRPLPNYRVFILDEQLRLVPIGCPGELCIAGVGVGRGYLGDAELTNRKFVASPWDASTRLYRTGDAARWRADGNLEFLGRIDRQIKIRGFRVELGEIEAALREHAGVVQAVVTCEGADSPSARLLAYVTADPCPSAVEEFGVELQRRLAAKLPAHMVPAVITVLSDMPLTSSGKIDLQALPKPLARRPELGVAYVAPRTSTEHKLAKIWQGALLLDRVGVHDNYFDLGGHSLLAAQIMHQVQQELHILFPYRLFLDAPTIGQMAERLDAISRGEDTPPSASEAVDSLVPLATKAQGHPVFCLHSLGGQVHEYRYLVQGLAEVCPVYGVQSRAILNVALEQISWAAMAESYAAVIRQQQPDGPYRLVGHSAGGVLALAVAEALERQDQTVDFVCLIDSYWNLEEASIAAGAEADLLASLEASAAKVAPQFVPYAKSVAAASPVADPKFFSLSHAEQVAKIDEYLAGTPHLPAGLSSHFRNQLQLHLLHRSLLDAYSLPRISAPLFVFWASELLPGASPLARHPWDQCTSGSTSSESVEASHWSILGPPVVTAIAAQIAARCQSRDQQLLVATRD